MLPIFIDIDGTLTGAPTSGGDPIQTRVDTVKRMIEDGDEVVLWSAAGSKYAQAFATTHGIQPTAAIGKPEYCIDDTESIKWNGLTVKPDTWLDDMYDMEKAVKIAKEISAKLDNTKPQDNGK